MVRTILLIVCTVIFTILGIVVGTIILINRPSDFHDPEGFTTAFMLIAPTFGGLVAGFFIGLIAGTLLEKTRP
jgi:hypothetical protein